MYDKRVDNVSSRLSFSTVYFNFFQFLLTFPSFLLVIDTRIKLAVINLIIEFILVIFILVIDKSLVSVLVGEIVIHFLVCEDIVDIVIVAEVDILDRFLFLLLGQFHHRFLDRNLFAELDQVQMLEFLRSGSRRNQMSGNDVFLESTENIDLAEGSGIGQNSRGILERCRRNKAFRFQRGFRDTEKNRFAFLPFLRASSLA